MTEWLATQGHEVKPQACLALMDLMGVEGRLPETEAEPAGGRPPDLPVLLRDMTGGARQPGCGAPISRTSGWRRVFPCIWFAVMDWFQPVRTELGRCR